MSKEQEREILTPEEVAEYLRVSERTVYNWAQKGEIPAGKLGTSWRFKKSDIEAWVNSKLSPKSAALTASGIRLENILSPHRALFLKSVSKKEALLELIAALSSAPQVRDREELEREIFNREELMSTGIGHGIAIPHVRIGSVTDLVGALGISTQGIADYQSLDGETVRIIIMLAGAYNQHALYLKALSHISAKLKNPAVRETLVHAVEPREAYDLLVVGEPRSDRDKEG